MRPPGLVFEQTGLMSKEDFLPRRPLPLSHACGEAETDGKGLTLAGAEGTFDLSTYC